MMISTTEHDRMEEIIDEHGFFTWLGLETEEIEHGHVVLSVPYDEKFTNLIPGGEANVHGGVAATLIDSASGFALRSTFDDSKQATLTTTDLNVSYLRSATDDLTAEAEVVRAGGSMGVTDATVSSIAPDSEQKSVAVGRTSYRLFRGEQ